MAGAGAPAYKRDSRYNTGDINHCQIQGVIEWYIGIQPDVNFLCVRSGMLLSSEKARAHTVKE